MKSIVTAILMLLGTCLFSQDSLVTASGFVIHPGDEILMGIGTMPDGSFKYIVESRSNIFSTQTGNEMQTAAKKCSGHKYPVKKFRRDGKESTGYTYAVILNGENLLKYEMNADAAISTGEIIVPEKYRPKAGGAASSLSASEQLEKLAKLYKDSLITKEEFETQKKKILSQ